MKSLRSFSSFSKGRLALSKLRDKATIDDEISHVNLVFPDQYGRLSGMKISAEHFLDVVDGKNSDSGSIFFEYKYNPFRYDAVGSEITFDEDLPSSLLLSPDLTTLKEMPW